MFLDIVEKRDITYGPYQLPVSILDVLCPRSFTVKNAIYGYLEEYMIMYNEKMKSNRIKITLLKKEKQMVHVYDLYCTIECKHRQTWFKRRCTCAFINETTFVQTAITTPILITTTHLPSFISQYMGHDFPFFITRL